MMKLERDLECLARGLHKFQASQLWFHMMRACDAGWDESKHPRAENGQFGSGATATNQHGKIITKSYNPADYTNLEVGKKSATKETPVGGFEGKGKTQVHIKSHMENVGAKNENDYKKRAMRFLSKPLGENMEELLTEGGKRLRYDYSTNEFGVANSRGNISTYYKPDEGIKYWEDRIKKHGSER